MAASSPLLEVRGLVASIPGQHGPTRLVDGVDLEVGEAEILGLVGESGSGKSVTLRSLVRLTRPPIGLEGRVAWRGRDLLALPEAALRSLRGREIGMIFQEPMAALNPVLTVGRQIDESLRAHTDLGRRARRNRAVELLDLVGIPAPAHRLDDHPHAFSGGMRQRAMLAIALAAAPRLLLADEPTTALDVTIQDQILRLLLRLRDELGMSVILVTHDLGVVAQTCDRVAVMYAGRIVESGPVTAVLTEPRHAYTLGLMSSVPGAESRGGRLQPIPGAPPAVHDRPPGCPFNPRCAFVEAGCRSGRPAMRQVGPEHDSACLAADRLPARMLAA